jgi:hypothetical protein
MEKSLGIGRKPLMRGFLGDISIYFRLKVRVIMNFE